MFSQVIWMKQILKDINEEFDHPLSILCDNLNAISISNNTMMHSKTKHIPIKYHFLREQAAKNTIKLDYVDTKEQIVDIFTNILPKNVFEYLKHKLGVTPSP